MMGRLEVGCIVGLNETYPEREAWGVITEILKMLVAWCSFQTTDELTEICSVCGPVGSLLPDFP